MLLTPYILWFIRIIAYLSVCFKTDNVNNTLAMPTSSLQTVRIHVIDRCLKDKYNDYTFEDILEEVNKALTEYDSSVQVRQLRKDFAFIRKEYKKEIKTHYIGGHKPCYRYADPDNSIYTNELSDEELSQLRSTIQMFSRFRGTQENAWLENVLSSLEIKFGVKSNPENLIDFDDYDNVKGLEYLSTVIDATLNHTPLGIDYQAYGSTPVNWLIYPYYVKQFNGRWFLFGWNKDKNLLSNLALDRISHITAYGFDFRKNDSIDFHTYFDDIIGVTHPKVKNEDGVWEDVPVETIVMRFSPKRFPYAKTKKMHHSFTVLSEEECTASVTLRPNNEFYARVLEYGPDIEILSPDNVREQIKEKVQKMYQKYYSVHDECTQKH